MEAADSDGDVKVVQSILVGHCIVIIIQSKKKKKRQYLNYIPSSFCILDDEDG